MKFNNAYSQMFPGWPPDAVSPAGCGDARSEPPYKVGELIRSRRLFALKIGRTYRGPEAERDRSSCSLGRAPSRAGNYRWMWYAVGAATE